MFMKKLTQKKLAKAVVGGLLVSCGLFAGMGQASAEVKIDGQTMNVYGAGNFFDLVFEDLETLEIKKMNFYIDKTVENGSFMLIGGLAPMAFPRLERINAGVQNGSNLQVGDFVVLLSANPITGLKGVTESKCFVLSESDFKEYGLKFGLADFILMARVTSLPNDNLTGDAKSPVETQAAGLTLLTTGADMLASQGFDNAASAVAGEVKAGGSANTLTPFVTMGGVKKKVKTGSYVDVKGWNLNVGFAKEINNKAGKLLIGPVVEYGKGSYDSYLDDGFHGEGDTHYIGGGVMAKQTNNNGFYYEGSLRAGKLSNDYKSLGISSNSYDSDSTYYAAHVGLGKIVKLSEKNTLDYYGKYFYTHQKGDDATLRAGDIDYKLHFDSMNSNRTRIGGRFTHAMNEKSSIYAGLAWQHEFSGTARAAMDGAGTPAPSLKGNTGLMELGWKVEAGRKVDLDLNATGYTGKQKGASLNLSLNYKF